jgi:5'-3' exonuclease
VTLTVSTATSQNRLLAIDLSAVFHRNWHGAQHTDQAMLPDGRGVWGVTGTVLTILKTLAAAPYTHLLIAAESHGAGAPRREILAEYKAHRTAPDAELVAQMRDTWNVLTAAGWPVVGVISKEADDILASAAAQFEGPVDILTGDRDLLATCTEHVNVLLFTQSTTLPRRMGPQDCEEMLGIKPEQICEWKALAGDTSDGIPGVAGIGAKGAAKILRYYGTLRSAYADPILVGIPPRLRPPFRDGHDVALKCWQVARLDKTVAVAGKWKLVTECFAPQASQAVTQMGFGSLARQLSRSPRVVETPVSASN